MDVLRTEDRGAVRVISLARPEKRNALNHALTRAVLDALDAAEADGAVRAVVLRGEGPGFCAGADLSEFKDLTPENAARVSERAALTAALQARIPAMGTPVVCALRGAAMGGGGGLALACDMIVASEDARMGFPEVGHGIVPALVMAILARHFGRKLGFELVSTGRVLTAADLSRLGIARTVPGADLDAEALAVAEGWAAANPSAMRAAKALFGAVQDVPFAEAVEAGRAVNEAMRGFR